MLAKTRMHQCTLFLLKLKAAIAEKLLNQAKYQCDIQWAFMWFNQLICFQCPLSLPPENIENRKDYSAPFSHKMEQNNTIHDII